MTERYLTKLYIDAFASLTVVGPEWKLPTIQPFNGRAQLTPSHKPHETITWRGRTMTFAQWAKEVHVGDPRVLRDRMRRWKLEDGTPDLDRVMTAPVRPRGGDFVSKKHPKKHNASFGATFSHERMAG